MSGLLLQKFPAATIVLVDFSERMLDVARQRFAEQPGIEYRVGDYRSADRGGRTTSSSRRSRSTTWNPGRGRGCSSGSTRRSYRKASSSTPTRRTARRRTSPGGTSSTGTSTSRPARWRGTSTRGSKNTATGSTGTTRSPTSSGGSARPVFTTSTWCTGTGPSSSPWRRSRGDCLPPDRERPAQPGLSVPGGPCLALVDGDAASRAALRIRQGASSSPRQTPRRRGPLLCAMLPASRSAR